MKIGDNAWSNIISGGINQEYLAADSRGQAQTFFLFFSADMAEKKQI